MTTIQTTPALDALDTARSRIREAIEALRTAEGFAHGDAKPAVAELADGLFWALEGVRDASRIEEQERALLWQ